MTILELAKEVGLNPVRTSSTNGGEYKSPCPECGGDDRFRIWPYQDSTGRYWCRQCEKADDAIQFCRDFMGMKFPEALAKVGSNIPLDFNEKKDLINQRFSFKALIIPSSLWINSATAFVERAHLFLLKNPTLLNLDKNRGLSSESIKGFRLGWNDTLTFAKKNAWGIEIKEGENQTLCLPRGIVIPSFINDTLIRIKIRREQRLIDDKFPKYHIVTGGIGSPVTYGVLSNPIVLVEAELDAMLVQQIVGNLCSCIALGGVSNRSDKNLHEALQKASLILYALDFDDAGKQQFLFWRSTYSKLRAWPVPKSKSPGDAFNLGIDLRSWVLSGINQFLGYEAK